MKSESRVEVTGIGAVVVALIATLAIVGTAHASTLKVDFSGTKIQTGFTAQGAVDAVYDLGNGLSVTVDLPDGASLSERGMSTVVPSSGSAFISDGTDINALEDDFIFAGYSGGSNYPQAYVIISGALGNIYWEGWFADLADTVSSELQAIYVSTDGGSTWSPKVEAQGCGINPSPTALSATANGTDDVIFWIDGLNSADHQLRFNGFALEANPVPEPTTIALLLTGAIGLYARRKRQ